VSVLQLQLVCILQCTLVILSTFMSSIMLLHKPPR